jgi:hypothetical protein
VLNVTTARATQTAPDAPTIASQTPTSVTLEIIPGAEYSKDGTTWQDDVLFDNLTPTTAYTFYARLKETTTQLPSPSSLVLNVTTARATQTAPDAPTIASQTPTSVTLDAIANAEYSINGTTWQDDVLFDNLTPNTLYTFYARFKGSITQLTSVLSEPTTIATGKLIQNAPAAPTLASRTSTSVTLDAIFGAEYSINGNAWQDGETFDNLKPNTPYTFYARFTETDTQLTSTASKPATLTTEKVALTGAVRIVGVARYGETLTADTALLAPTPEIPDLGAFTYQWKCDSKDVGTAPTYTVKTADIGKFLFVGVTTKNTQNPVFSSVVYVEKAAQSAPATPTIASQTPTSVTLAALSGAKFAVSDTATAPDTATDSVNAADWQDSPVFTDLTPGETYYFFAYRSETATHAASTASAGEKVTTSILPTPPQPPTFTGGVNLPATKTAIAGEPLTLRVTVTGTSPFHYSWRKNGVAIPGAPDAPSYTFTPALSDNGAKFSVVVTGNISPGATSTALTLTVNAAPETPEESGDPVDPPPPGPPQVEGIAVVVAPGEPEVNPAYKGILATTVDRINGIRDENGKLHVAHGSTVFYSVAATGKTLSYQWKKNGTKLEGATGAVFSTVITQSGDRYSVVVTDAEGIVAPETVAEPVLVVFPASIAAQPAPESVIAAGASVTLSVGAVGPGQIYYQWYKLGADGETWEVIPYAVLATCTTSEAGIYRVLVTNYSGLLRESESAVVRIE